MFLILKASQIPNDTLVSKITGTNWFTLKRQIVIFLENGTQKIIEAENNSVFLISYDGNINCFSGQKELKVNLETFHPNCYKEIHDFLNPDSK